VNPEKIFALACKGWLPAPRETEEQFSDRIEQGKVTPNHFEKEERQASLLEKGSLITQKLFGFSIDWVPVIFSNRKLSFFEGAAAWIFQEKDDSPKEAFLQLRKNLKDQDKLYGYYSVQELVAHELVHVARMAFEEPLFEEMLAYETSTSSFRKMWGPLFRQPKEMNIFLMTLVLPLFGLFIPYLWTIPLLTLLFFIVRLFIHRRAFDRKKMEIKDAIPKEHQGLYLLALSDEEILEKGLPQPSLSTPHGKLLHYLLEIPFKARI